MGAIRQLVCLSFRRLLSYGPLSSLTISLRKFRGFRQNFLRFPYEILLYLYSFSVYLKRSLLLYLVTARRGVHARTRRVLLAQGCCGCTGAVVLLAVAVVLVL